MRKRMGCSPGCDAAEAEGRMNGGARARAPALLAGWMGIGGGGGVGGRSQEESTPRRGGNISSTPHDFPRSLALCICNKKSNIMNNMTSNDETVGYFKSAVKFFRNKTKRKPRRFQ
uniref:Uncharacterized protein n=1 Tax=Oryza nivara TaxID=4536 RepID=A0A0E0GW36_ORYNI